jgi:hypothetical protein
MDGLVLYPSTKEVSNEPTQDTRPNSWSSSTDHDGLLEGKTIELADVPIGKYFLEVWHEKLGKATQEVEVRAGETVNVTFEFQAKK